MCSLLCRCSLFGQLARSPCGWRQAKRGRRPKPPRTCASCFTTNSSQWRTGPSLETLCNKCGIASRRCQRTGRHFVPVYPADPSSVEEGAATPSSSSPPLRSATAPPPPPQTIAETRHYAPLPCVPSLERLSSPTSSASHQHRPAPSSDCGILPSFSALTSACLCPFEKIPYDLKG
jgi:GATA zinc finger